MKLAERIRKQPQWLITAEALLLVAIVGVTDYISGYDLTIFVLYAGPILFASWFCDREKPRTATLIAVSCAAAWLMADAATSHGPKSPTILLGNTCLQLGFLGFVVLSSSALRLQLLHSRAEVAELKRFHILAEIAPTGIFRTDSTGKVLHANHLWCSFTGLNIENALGGHWSDAIHPGDRRRVKGSWKRQCETLFPFQARFIKPGRSDTWVLGQIAPERDGRGVITGYVGAVADLTEHRELEQQILDISEREQQRIGQDLHDDLCQFLAAIQYAASSLRSDLKRRNAPESGEASEIADLLKESIARTRGLARRIFPVQLEEMGLISALHELAASTSRFFDIHCTFDYTPPFFIDDSTAATHIFRIAQEALNNAIKHGSARSVSIFLETTDDDADPESDRLAILTITDDGTGFRPEGERSGMGLRIMEYRSHMIGGTLKISSPPEEGDAAQGTQVRCVFRLKAC